MGRRRAARRPSYPRWLLIVAVTAVAVVGLVAGALVLPTFLDTGSSGKSEAAGMPTPSPEAVLPTDQPAAAPGAGPCIQLNVLASLENADMVRSLAAEYMAKPRSVDGLCVTVNVTQEKSGVAATRRAAHFAATPEAERPAVWLPDSTAWLRIAKDKAGNGSGFEQQGTSVARSGIVVAMPASMAKAIGWDAKAPSWADVFKAAEDPGVWERSGHADWGKFKFGKASPTVSTSGLMGLVAAYGVAGQNLKDMDGAELGKAAVIEKVKAGELSTSHYMATPEHFLWHARQHDDTGDVSEFMSAVIVDEKSVWDYNRGISSNDGVTKQSGQAPKEPLLAIYPNDGVLVADNPAVILEGNWISSQQNLAAKDFITYTGTEQGQTVVKTSGYRSIQDKVDPVVASTGRYANSINALPMPADDVLVTVQKSFPDVRKRARALFLLDVSGSMAQEIAPGVTRLQGAKNAVTKAMDHFTGEDQLGMAAFSHLEGGKLWPGLVSPVAPFKTNKADLLAKLDALKPVAYTPLFEAVGMFAARQASEYDDSAINTIVLLSDGKNDTTHAGSLKDLTEQLSHQHHTTPVLVFTLAYGADADTDSLRAIAKASGAHFYDATDPNRLEAVLGDLVTSF
jgi:Ca-activated chloride channel family protein